MDIKNCIVHELHTEQGKKEVRITNKRDKELKASSELQFLVKDVLKSYRKEANLAYGDFKDPHIFPEKLTDFLENKIDFVAFSHRALEELRERMEDQLFSTGGYLLFIHYHDKSNFLLVVMLKEAAGLSFDKNLELQDIERLDLDKLHFAANINFSIWNASTKSTTEKRYISFLKGTSRENVTEYFKKFLGIDDSSYVDQRENTRALKEAIRTYSKENNWTADREHVARIAARDYGYKQVEFGEPIDLQVIARFMEPEDPKKFITFVQRDDVKLQGGVTLSKAELRKFTRLVGKNDYMSIRIEQEALEGDKPKAIWKNGILTISEVPKNLKKLLDDYSGD